MRTSTEGPDAEAGSIPVDRQAVAGVVVLVSTALIVTALTVAGWYDVHFDGILTVIPFPDLGRDLAHTTHPSVLGRGFVLLTWGAAGLAAMAVLLAVMRPVGARRLRIFAISGGLLAPVLILRVLSRDWGASAVGSKAPPYNPFIGLHIGFWIYAGGCWLLAVAALLATPRVGRRGTKWPP